MVHAGKSAAPSRGGARTIAVVACLVIAVAAAGATASYVTWRLSARAAWDAEHPERTVPVEVTAEGYEPAPEAPCALRVVGTEDGGDAVAGYAVITQPTSSLMLEPGSYEISVAGCPMRADGVLYLPPG